VTHQRATVPPDESAAAVVGEIVTRLRTGGLAVSTGEALDAVQALGVVDLGRRREVKVALKATLVKDGSREVLFERAFEAVLPRPRRQRPETPDGPRGAGADTIGDELLAALRDGDEEALDSALEDAIDRFSGVRQDSRSAGHHTQRALRRLNVAELYRRFLESSRAGSELDRAVNAAEAQAALAQLKRRLEELVSGRIREADGPSRQQVEDPEDRPLLQAGADELAAMRVAMRPLARRLATRLNRRRRRGTSGLDMRRTIRASMGTGGVPVNPVLRRMRPSKPDLVVLCDVSGSTAQFAPFTLTLLHAVHQEFSRVRSFVFIDGIVEITEVLRTSPGVLDPRHLLGHQGLIVKDGRSDYHRAFSTFLETWGAGVTARTTVIIAGDTRSHRREPATPQLAELHHRARRLYWLNPEPVHLWDHLDSMASEYGNHCTQSFEVSTIRQLISAVTEIV
jgi:uncharacterized protein with von Willebrand factor type A (vWA) domain